MKNVLGVISNTPALNVEAITQPQNAQTWVLLDYVGPHKPSSCKNLLSATKNPAAVADKLSKELSLGRIAGPFLE